MASMDDTAILENPRGVIRDTLIRIFDTLKEVEHLTLGEIKTKVKNILTLDCAILSPIIVDELETLVQENNLNKYGNKYFRKSNWPLLTWFSTITSSHEAKKTDVEVAHLYNKLELKSAMLSGLKFLTKGEKKCTYSELIQHVSDVHNVHALRNGDTLRVCLCLLIKEGQVRRSGRYFWYLPLSARDQVEEQDDIEEI